ncbi:MAG: LAGLIDADG family homing endonuclease [archaeon]
MQEGDGQISRISDFAAGSVYSTNFKELKGEAAAVSCKSKRNDIKETYLIDTGCKIEASPEHRFFRLDGFEIKEAKAKDICKGDYLLQVGSIDIENEEQEIPKMEVKEFVSVNKKGAELIKNSIQKMGFTREEFCQEMPFSARDLRAHLNQGQPISLNNMQALVGFGVEPEAMDETEPVFNYMHRPLTMPETFSQEIAQATGYFLGDGSIGKRDLRFRDQRREVLETYDKLFKGLFNIEGKFAKVKGKNCWQLSINSKEITGLFSYIKKNYIPLITKSPKPVAKSFIRGFVDAEGYVDKSLRRISISQKDTEILQIIQLLLLRFGIKSKIRVCGIKKPFAMLEMFSEDVAKYSKEIGVSALDKRKQLEKWAKEFKGNLAKEIVPIERKEVWHFLKELFKHPSRVITPRPYKYITLNDVNNILKAADKQGEIPKEHKEKIMLLKAIQGKKIAFGKVVSIKKQKNDQPLYDISVPKTGNYIANGFIVHNSKTRLYLRKSKADTRVAKLVDSPSLPDGEAIFRVTENGIEDV